MKEELLKDLKELGKKYNGTLLEGKKFGKVVKYILCIPGSNINLILEDKKGGTL